MTSPGKTLRGGALNAAISNAVVGLLGDYVGKGPTRARAFHSGKIVLCVLEDTMTKAERSLVTDGKDDLVLAMRHAFQETMKEDLSAAVEGLTGRRVVAFMSANHVEPDFAAELFVLDGPITDGALSRRGTFNAEELPVATSRSSDALTRDAGRWLDDGGSFSSQAVAASKSPNT